MKQLAIMKGVDFGLRDAGTPVLWFSTYISECSAALQVLVGREIEIFLKDSGCYSIKELEGKSCWVECDGGLIHFRGYAKI